MTYWMGIDGGGSHLRVVIVTSDLTVMAQAQLGTANPSIVGHEESAQQIRNGIRAVLQQSDLTLAHITGVGIGVAGASVEHSEAWLRQVLSQQLSRAFIVPSSDCEIALVGAHGEQRGVLLLSGTGSIAYGINCSGAAVRVGGWGYLLGDEGSGFRIGLNALQAVTRAADGRGEATLLTPLLFDRLGLASDYDLIRWLYKSEFPHNREIADLAPLVLEAARTDSVALRIIESAAQDLYKMYQTLIKRLGDARLPVGFAGGMLTSSNLLSLTLCELLGLPNVPSPRYAPVVGAALLAQIRSRETTC